MGVKYKRKQKITNISISKNDKKGSITITKKYKNKCPVCGGTQCCRMRNA